jgi:hypothetical protein
MGYADAGSVQARMPQFQLSATSKPSLDDVPELIKDAEQELNAILANLGYSVPIDPVVSPLSWQIVVAMTAYGTIWRILEARNAAVGGEATAQSAERANKYVTDRIAWLADPKNPFELTDAVRSGLEIVKPAEILQRIDWPDTREGENWPFSRRTSMSQLFAWLVLAVLVQTRI